MMLAARFIIFVVLWLLHRMVKISLVPIKVWSDSEDEKRRYKPVPGIRPWPIFGNVLTITKLKHPIEGVPANFAPFQCLEGFCELFKHEGIFKLVVGTRKVYVAFKGQHLEKIMPSTSLINKPEEYDFFGPWLGLGLITSNGSTWRARRKLLTPTFHFKILDRFHPIIDNHAVELVNHLKAAHVIGQPVNLGDIFSQCTFEVICETSMGYKLDLEKNEEDAMFVTAIHEAGDSLMTRIISPWLWPNILFGMSPSGRRFNSAVHTINTFINKVIVDRKAETLKNLTADKGLGKPDRLAFLDLLLVEHIKHKTLSETDLSDEVKTFMFAGQDSTATALLWSFFLLGHHQDIQDKVVQEIEGVIGDDPEVPVTLENIKDLKFMDCVIKEAQRLYPIVPIIARRMDEDLELDGNMIITKGSTMVIFAPGLGRNSTIYEDPLVFRPERFLPENSGERHTYDFIPFSAGPRNCIGQRFAMLEIKTVLCYVLRNFVVTSVQHRDQVILNPQVILRPAKPLTFYLKSRH